MSLRQPHRILRGTRRGWPAAALLVACLAGCAPRQDAPRVERVEVISDETGMRLQVDGRDFMVNGMNWDYFPRGTTYDYALWSQPDDIILEALEREMSLLRDAGVNAIRQYVGVPPRWVEHIWSTYGIYTVLNHPLGRYGVEIEGEYVDDTDYSDPRAQARLISEVSAMVEQFRDTPGVLMWLLGNENNYGLVWSSAETEAMPEELQDTARARWLYRTFGMAVDAVKAVDRLRPVALANGDLQYLEIIREEVPGLDVFGANIYRGITFGGAYQEVQQELGLPVLFTELGADAYNARDGREDQLNQARFLLGQWKEIYSNAAGMGGVGNALGGLTFQWSDGWWKVDQEENLDVQDTTAGWPADAYTYDYVEGQNNMNEEWWGVVAKGPADARDQFDLYPRAAYYTLQKVHRFDPYAEGADLDALSAHIATIRPEADVETAARQ